MESSEEFDDQMIKIEEPQINSGKFTKKNTLKKSGKTDESLEIKENHAKETENFFDRKIEEGQFYKENNTEKSLVKQESFKVKNKKIKQQIPDANKVKNYDEVIMTSKKQHKSNDDEDYKQEIENENRISRMSYDKDDIIKASYEESQKKRFGIDSDEDMQGDDIVLEKKTTLKKQHTNQNIEEDLVSLNKKISLKNSSPEIQELFFDNKHTEKIPEESKVPVYDGTIKKEPKKQEKLENHQKSNIEKVSNPENIIDEFKGFKETFSADNSQRFFDKEESRMDEKKNKKQKNDIKKSKGSSKSSSSSSRSLKNDKPIFAEDKGKSFKQERPENLINRLFTNEIMTHDSYIEKVVEHPETPNLGSPIKETKHDKSVKDANDAKRSQGSAYWSRNEFELENRKLRAKILEYEEIINQQSEEIKELKIQLDQKTEKPIRVASPKSSGHIQKKPGDIFLKKKSDLFKKDDIDFWKVIDDGQSTREPQHLEDISALKDLWILNIDSGSALYNNISMRKPQGVKSNALTRVETSKRGNTKSRVLPKIATKNELRSISKK
ncbi:hypothetical protein SteCoe_1886 [Stentor coeruleus]|uniref:Uncharacterized protein n=1 Tax=Stentor coeruleus TaxID=5963 RepID=A0A1R2D0W7_9CILI|nr:hypothetical protein SteCoe_1886 [Stentor coeruleus]